MKFMMRGGSEWPASSRRGTPDNGDGGGIV
jgi:hypothetical protein